MGPRKDVVRRPPWLVQAQTAPLIAPLAWTYWSGMALPGKMWSVHDYKALGAMVKGMMAQAPFSVIFLGERERCKDDWKDPVGKQLFVDLVSSSGIKLSLPFLRI